MSNFYLFPFMSLSFANMIFFRFTFSAEQLTVAQLFKNVTFEKNLFDPIQWQPIDDKIVTEIHEKHQILPCAFPHRDYFTKNNINPLKCTAKKQIQPKVQMMQRRKIQPKDDSMKVIRRVEKINNLRRGKWNKQNATRKNAKRFRRRLRKNAMNEAAKIELDETTEAKKDLVARMDQYNTINGCQLNNKIMKQEFDSVASRTRRKFNDQSSSPNSSNVLFTVRRSDRFQKSL